MTEGVNKCLELLMSMRGNCYLSGNKIYLKFGLRKTLSNIVNKE